MAGFLKFSGFKRIQRILSDYWIVGYGGDKNFRISFQDFYNQLELSGSTGGGTPIFFEGNNLPSVNNEGQPLEKGDWTLLAAGETYTNIGGGESIEAPSDKISFGIFNGDHWDIKNILDLPIIQLGADVAPGDDRGVTGDTAYRQILEPIGVEHIPPGLNIVEYLNPLDVSDRSEWLNGYYKVDGTIYPVTAWVRKLIPIKQGSYKTNNYVGGNAYYVVFDSEMNIVNTYGNKGHSSGSVEWTFDVPEDGFLGISQAIATLYHRYPFYITSLNASSEATDKVFVLSRDFVEKTEEVQKEVMENVYDVKPTPAGTNFAQELAESSITDLNFWKGGFLRENGTVEGGANWYHTANYLYLKKGRYSMHFFFAGNARAIIYNLDETIRRTIINPSGLDERTYTVTIESDALIRFSHRQSSDQSERLPSVFITNVEDIHPIIVTSDNIKDYADKSLDLRKIWRDQLRVKMKRPVVTLISDDLHQYNETWYVPMLDEYGVKSTFAVIGNRTLEADNGVENGYLNSEYVKYLHENKHNIASHTWTHGHMKQMDLAVVEDELARTRLFLENIIGTRVNMFISPFGERNAAIDNLVSKYYDANFITGYGSINSLPLDSYFINRVSFDALETDPQLRWETVLKPAIDEAIATNNWTCFAVHPQYTQYRGVNGELRKNELRTLIEYCMANNVQILTADRAYDYWKNAVEIGVQRVDGKYYKLAMDGTETNVGYFED